MNPTTLIYIVRHGETDWNREKRIQGHADIPLNTAGLEQAQALARMLAGRFAQTDTSLPRHSARLFSSDLQRAMQTAACIGAALHLTVELEQGLRERRYGIFEGLRFADAQARYPAEYAHFKAREAAYALPEGGESLSELNERIIRLLSDWASRYAGQTLIAVTHGGILDIVNRFVRRLPLESERDFLIPNAACNLISHKMSDTTEDGFPWRLERWGEIPPDTSPLRSMMDEPVR